MSWTKRQIIQAAFEEIGMASYAYDADPQDLQDAMRKLDAMMAEWHERSIQIAWPLNSDPTKADLDTDTKAPLYANSAIYLNLGLRLCPALGKEPSRQHSIDAKNALNVVQGKLTKPRLRRMRGLPSGAGNGGSSSFNPLPDVDKTKDYVEPNITTTP